MNVLLLFGGWLLAVAVLEWIAWAIDRPRFHDAPAGRPGQEHNTPAEAGTPAHSPAPARAADQPGPEACDLALIDCTWCSAPPEGLAVTLSPGMQPPAVAGVARRRRLIRLMQEPGAN